MENEFLRLLASIYVYELGKMGPPYGKFLAPPLAPPAPSSRRQKSFLRLSYATGRSHSTFKAFGRAPAGTAAGAGES